MIKALRINRCIAGSRTFALYFFEAYGSCFAGCAIQLHFEEVNGELTVQAVEFIIGLVIWRVWFYFLQVVFVEGALLVEAFSDSEELTAFNRDEGMTAEWETS